MASRKEQKAALRREREEREAAAKAAERRRRLIGYGSGLAVALAAVIVGVLLLSGGASGGGDDDTPGGGDQEVAADILPEGGSVPEPQGTDLIPAAQQAGCELLSFRADSRRHSQDLTEEIEYESLPPSSGPHYIEAAEDGDYEKAPDVNRMVHSLEHGRVIVWFKKDLPGEARAQLKALYDEDTFQMLITPDETGSEYEVAATAWNRDPLPNGTGRLLGCAEFSPAVFEAIRAFKDEHRSNGPEPVP